METEINDGGGDDEGRQKGRRTEEKPASPLPELGVFMFKGAGETQAFQFVSKGLSFRKENSVSTTEMGLRTWPGSRQRPGRGHLLPGDHRESRDDCPGGRATGAAL